MRETLKRRWIALRCALIALVAGKMSVVLNVAVDGEIRTGVHGGIVRTSEKISPEGLRLF
jgi:hypothetical protein